MMRIKVSSSRRMLVAPRAPCSSRTACSATKSAVPTPSNCVASSQLQNLQRYSTVLSDKVVMPKSGDAVEDGASAAVVSFRLLADTLASASLCEYSTAIEKGVTLAKHEGGSTADAMDYALVNIGLLLKDRVSGRIVTEVDPRCANDTEALVARAQFLVAAYEARGCTRDHLLMQIPATWAGIQAVKNLETSGVQCQVVDIFSFSQAVAAVTAKASVVVPHIRRINLWYEQHPGAVRDPKGPREDAGGASSVNVGVRLASAMYDYTRQFGAGTKIVMSGIRSEEEAVQLSGADYLIVSDKLQAQMDAEQTLQGYNDGLSAQENDDDEMPVLSPLTASQHEFSKAEIEEVTESSFQEDLGMAGRDLLEQQIKSSIESADRISHFIENFAVGRE